MLKRVFDSVFSLIAIVVLFPILSISWFIACFDTVSSGIFYQKRVGQFGKPFTIYKLRSMHSKTQTISKWGGFLRKSKLDELPQLFNVLFGNMSMVGPRPDVIGYYNNLQGEERKILELKPGLTCEASLKYSNEEVILKNQKNPVEYNDKVLFPDKVKMNLAYYYNNSFVGDLKIILKTVVLLVRR